MRYRLLLSLCIFAVSAAAQAPDSVAFFESKVRPVFAAKCMACHSDAARSGGLTLTSRGALLEGGNRGPSVVPGAVEQSVLIEAVRQAGDLKMPPGGQLAPEEIAALEKWVAAGAVWPESKNAEASKTPAADHWSFQPVESPDLPAVGASGSEHPIDRFIEARLAKDNLKLSEEADRTTLLRRISLDLIGLPPTPEETEAFLNDRSPDAYEKQVDRLLASPHYGERWGRHWLDIAHYADSNGYNIDGERDIWMYRDWVIDALNSDKPFDEFVIEQIAGDLLPEPSEDQLIATGFHRNTLLNLEGGIDFEQYRVEAVVDRVDTIGAAFLGLTLGCARCHTHKFDPISQKEFYQLYSFYDSIDELSGADGEEDRRTAHKPVIEFGSPEELHERDVIQSQIDLLQAELDKYQEKMRARQAEWEASLSEEFLADLTPENRTVFETSKVGERNVYQRKAAEKIYRAQDKEWQYRYAAVSAVRKLLPELRSTMVMKELPEPRVTNVHLGGDFLRKGIEVQPGTLAVLPPMEGDADRPTRLDLARWLVSDANPLTPRVTVNRYWQRFFGRGIVETENDFGTQGRAPTHPKLLDWMAAEFRDNGWGVKAMHRLIVTSKTYRQKSDFRADADDVDPRNLLLARQNRLRLEAEIIRDAGLAVSGLLTPTIGGPSVFPPQPAGASKLGQMQRDWIPATDENRYRRGMYTFFWRASPHPGLMVFDAPDSTVACTRRPRSNTPLQALTLLNDEAHVEFAQAFAKRLADEGPEGQAEKIDYGIRLALGRAAHPEETERLGRFYQAQLDDFQTRPAETAGETAEQAAWTSVARVLLNLDEFMTRE